MTNVTKNGQKAKKLLPGIPHLAKGIIIAITCATVTTAASCSLDQECGSHHGADTADEAMRQLLEAVESQDYAAACEVTSSHHNRQELQPEFEALRAKLPDEGLSGIRMSIGDRYGEQIPITLGGEIGSLDDTYSAEADLPEGQTTYQIAWTVDAQYATDTYNGAPVSSWEVTD